MTETRRGNAGGLYVKESTMSKGYERRYVDAIISKSYGLNQKQGRHPMHL